MGSAEKRHFRLVVEYDGSGFHGWQAQAGVRTVEGTLREAAQGIVGGSVSTAGASRTDAGVHARGQSVCLSASTGLDAAEFARALQASTPRDLGIVSCHEIEGEFHARYDALEKRYLYTIDNSTRAPVFARSTRWWVRFHLDVEAMNRAGCCLVGEHDFAAFRNRSKDEPDETVRTLRAVDWQRSGDRICFQVIGSSFLYRMVRNLVGTLVEVGRGKLDEGEIALILASCDRRRGGPSAPPEGLSLMEVSYADTAPCRLEPIEELLAH